MHYEWREGLGMSFTIRGEGQAGAVTRVCATAGEALQELVQLLTKVARDVVVTDAAGNTLRHTDLIAAAGAEALRAERSCDR